MMKKYAVEIIDNILNKLHDHHDYIQTIFDDVKWTDPVVVDYYQGQLDILEKLIEEYEEEKNHLI